MTDTLNQIISYGLHSSAYDWTSTPTTVDLQLAENVHFWPSPEYNKITREGVVPGNNENVPGLRGVPNMSLPDVSMECEGLSASGAGDATDADTLSSTLEYAYECVFGVASNGSIGDTADGLDAGSGTTVTCDGSPAAVGGDFVLVKTTTGGIYQARQVESRSGSDITICRALTTLVGAADTADEGEVIYGGQRFFLDLDAPNHKHLYFKSEHVGGYEGEFFGVMPGGANWSVTAGDILRFNMTGLMATSWTKQAAQGGSYSAPTTGSKIVAQPIYVYLGSTLLMASNVSIDLGLQVVPRPAGQAEANHFGMVVRGARPTISCTVLYGDGTAPAEITETLMNTLQGTAANATATNDVLVQVGDKPGSCAVWRMEAADATDVQRTTVDGLEAVQITFTATDVGAAGNNPGCLSHAIF